MKWLFCFLSGFSCLAAGVRIGAEADIATPTSAEYVRAGAGRQPASNSVQTLNPPVFTWLYYEDTSLLPYPYNQTRVFNLQLSTNGSFASPLWNLTVSNNFYNLLPAITNADGSTWSNTVSWRVIYMNSNNSVALGTNPVHTFTMSASAIQWDRTCFKDSSYLTSLTNSHLLFAETNKAAFSLWLRTNAHGANYSGLSYSTYTQALTSITSQFWTNTSAMTNSDGWQHFCSSIAQLGVAFHADTNEAYTNAILNAVPKVGEVLSNYACQIMTQRLDQAESYQFNTIQDMRFFSLAYRLFRDVMTSAERAPCVACAESWMQWFIDCEWYYQGSATPTNRIYTNNLVNAYSSHAKMGDNHAKNDETALMLTLAFCDETPFAKWALEWYLSYYIAVFDPFQASDDGLGYSTVQNFAWDRQFAPWVIANMFFAGKGLTNSPIYYKIADMFAHQQPTGYRIRNDPYGQINCADCLIRNNNEWCYANMLDASILFQRGDWRRQCLRTSLLNAGGSPGAAESWLENIGVFHWGVPAEADATTNGFVHIENGWGIVSDIVPTDWGSHSNGFHVVMEARPSGAGRNNSDYLEGQIVADAYGAALTYGGAGGYEQSYLFHDFGLFVDGIGMNNPSPSVAYPVLAKIEAFTNAANVAYMRADLSYSFNRTNWTGDGSGNLQSANGRGPVDYQAPSNARPYILSVKRHVLLPKNSAGQIKYLLTYDSFSTSQNAQFQFRRNIWDSNATVNAAALTYHYTTTNNFNQSNVVVWGKQISDTALVGMTNLFSGVNQRGSNNLCYAKTNPFSGENYAGDGDWEGGGTGNAYDGQLYWANSVWVYNKTPTNTFAFLTVTYPQHWTNSEAPTITRIDDFTVAVTNALDGIADVVTFNTNYSSAFTFMVGISGSPPPPPPTLIQVAKGAGKMKLSGKAKIQ